VSVPNHFETHGRKYSFAPEPRGPQYGFDRKKYIYQSTTWSESSKSFISSCPVAQQTPRSFLTSNSPAISQQTVIPQLECYFNLNIHARPTCLSLQPGKKEMATTFSSSPETPAMRRTLLDGRSSKTTFEEWSGSSLAGLMYTRARANGEVRCKAGAGSKTEKMQMQPTVSSTLIRCLTNSDVI
jgi:hypothetical protein